MHLNYVLLRGPIRTKIFCLLTPILVGIVGLSLVNYLSGNMLNSQLASSSSGMVTLSAIKQAQDGMNSFLLEATEAKRDALKALLADQGAKISTSLSFAHEDDERRSLVGAATIAKEVSGKIDSLWEMHSDERKLRDQISTDLATLSDVQSKLQTYLNIPADQAAAQAATVETLNKINAMNYELRIAASDFLGGMNEDTLKKVKGRFKGLGFYLGKVKEQHAGNGPIQELADKAIAVIGQAQDRFDQLLVRVRARDAAFEAASASMNDAWNKILEFAQVQRDHATTAQDRAQTISLTTTMIALLFGCLAGFLLIRTIKTPIEALTASMKAVASGKLDENIGSTEKRDEIGEMARALDVFRHNALEKIRVESDAEQSRTLVRQQRQEDDLRKTRDAAAISQAVDAIASGLHKLASGDLTVTISHPLDGELDQLRQDFNGSMMRLQATMRQIRDNVEMIQGNGNQMAEAAEDLARRTEQQAASLEETAAAVDEITVTVRSSAERAKDADQIVRQAKRSADDSAVVVNNAIDAMGRIEEASRQIEQITGVIDEIAFQTNLLALNAGVEAARAGDAGKGFAVVAQEVRELAQRSAKAAKEIKALINKSTAEVTTGSHLVQETGAVLSQISTQIVTISQHVETIARGSHDQSSALQGVNATVNQMDQMTQHNAAMVEETTAASRELASQADSLLALVLQFRIEGNGQEAGFSSVKVGETEATPTVIPSQAPGNQRVA
ncbi:methyl-accepting chemotaxis protein [Agrobacterium rhizogenes]|nr:methyl-accepting chemotaxis protein [Rhizobium rhizogenes]MCZ7448212.1 methyl-accepting chemotaxis protein [Rhizobium rhizogenes]MCZ7465873.1 methyl-accepting chemotaxis protein [Rhizobium rhizogenes]